LKKTSSAQFEGFGTGIFKFFKDLEKNNRADWFAKNHDRYQAEVVLPAKAFITEMGDFFNRLNPSIRTEPKFNETIMRISNDMRFSKGDPYRTFLLIHFGRFKMDSELYVFINKEGLDIGLFVNGSKGDQLFFPENREKFSKNIIDVCASFDIDKKYDLYGFGKSQYLLKKKFIAGKHYEELSKDKMFLLQKSYEPESKKVTTANLTLEAIKIFANLYPLYCFAISPDPMKLIEEYENNFGVMQ